MTEPRAVPSSPWMRRLSLIILVLVCVFGAWRLLRSPWYQQVSSPVPGSFAAGPINQYYSAGQTLEVGDAPVARIDLKLEQHSPRDRVEALVEVRDAPDGKSLRSASFPVRRGVHWYSFSFPEIGIKDAPRGEIYVEVRSGTRDVLGDKDKVAIFYQRRDPYPTGRMYALGRISEPDADLGLRVYRLARPSEVLRKVAGLAAAHSAVWWIVFASAAVAAASILRLLWAVQDGPRWTALLVGSALLAVALNFPELFANPAIGTIGVALS